MSNVKKDLMKILEYINKVDPKCNDSNLSTVYNMVVDLMNKNKNK